MKNKKLFIIAILTISVFIPLETFAYCAGGSTCVDTADCDVVGTGYCGEGKVCCDELVTNDEENGVVEYDPDGDIPGGNIKPNSLIQSIAYWSLSIIGTFCVILIIYAGFLWAVAAGSQDKITKARNIIFYALIGLIIVISAFMIGQVIFTAIIGS